MEKDLICIGTFGFEDPVMVKVRDTVQLIKYGKILGDDDDD